MSTVTRSGPPTGLDETRPRRRLTYWLAGFGWVIMALACLYIVGMVSEYLTFDPEVYFAGQRENYLRVEVALGVHVLSGMLALLIGPLQFLGPLRRQFVRLHRFLGATYVASATALGVSGLILAPTAYTGLVAVAGFTVLDLAMLFTTWTAVRMIVVGRYADHRRWMIRSFSLILAGVMLRVLLLAHHMLTSAGIIDVSFETAYAAVAWLCWVPNLLLAIWFTRRSAAVAQAH